MNERTMRWLVVGAACLAIGTTAGCGTADDEGDVSEPDGAAGLSLGSRGDAVAKVHASLQGRGYFPDARIAAEFVHWVPAVAEGPTDLAVFDERTEEAVAIFQVHHGLASTGVVDEATWNLLMAPHCGNPVIHGAEASDKWHHDAQWSSPYALGGTFTYRVTVAPSSTLNQAQASAAVRAAFDIWEARAGVHFVENPASTTAVIAFTPIDGPSNTLGRTYNNFWGGSRYSVDIDTAENWNLTARNPSTVLVHELGHMLGFDHSSIAGSIMFPTGSVGPATAVLADDDLGALASRYRTWTTMAGGANDVGVGRRGTWVIGSIPVAFGFGILRFNGSTWNQVDGAAVRIAVGNEPWVVNDQGNIYRRDGVTAANLDGTSWVNMDNGRQAIDIGVAAGRNPWIISSEDLGTFGNAIRRWNGASWVLVDGAAVRVAVGEDSSVFVVNRTGQVYERQGITAANPSGTSWLQLGNLAPNIFGNETGFATDVGVTRSGIAWVAGTADGTPYTFLRQEQAALAAGTPTVQAFNRWLPFGGAGGRNIAAFNADEPWTANPGTSIQRRVRGL